MKEKPIKPARPEKSMVGRLIIKGKDFGDGHFHRVGWQTTPEAEQADLEAISSSEVTLAEEQAERLAEKDVKLGIKAYQGLIELFVHHEHTGEWLKRIEELKKR